jgi:hypothetical protein
MHATEYGKAFAALSQPHEAGIPPLMTLQVYSIPNARLIAAPDSVTIQPDFTPESLILSPFRQIDPGLTPEKGPVFVNLKFSKWL